MSSFVEKSARFWDGHAEKYAKQPIEDQEAYEKKLAITREYLTPDSKVLEFGCGTGSTALVHAPYCKEILAIDSSGKMIDIANQKVEEAGVQNVEFQQATLDDLPHADESFDVVLGLNILHLLEDMEGSVEKVSSLLKPGGIFISSTALVGEANLFFRLLLPLGGLFWFIPRVNIFNRKALEKTMEQAGMELLYNEMLNKSGLNCFMVARKKA